MSIDPDIGLFMEAEYRAGERAVTEVMRRTGASLKADWRGQIEVAGLGRRLARSIRNETYPKGALSMNAAALVWSKAPKIIQAHDRGITIRSKQGFWLAIPTEAAGKGRDGSRLTPGEWERRRGLKLRFVYRRGKPSFLVADTARISARGTAVMSRSKTGRGQVTAPIFILVPQVSLKKRLDLARDARKATQGIDRRIVAAWVDEVLK